MNRTVAALAALALVWSAVAAAAVSPELQQLIRAGTFEVVQKKPQADPATYEKELPLDLIPFHERNDAYRSVGTAFSLGHNTFVTAAHVLLLGIDSQYGVPALRSPDGAVHTLDRVLRFSLHEDFAVFSVQDDPAPGGFAVNREPRIDAPVLAVGNALGEGIVIRDGLYTSATDEDQDGLWKWIRFSAAASPGNSGGPLLDAGGRVIGIVIGKSPNENLNYSLPIGRVLDADEHQATFHQRVLTAVPYLQGTRTYAYTDQFPLPMPWSAFTAAYQTLMSRHEDEARNALLSAYAATAFPNGPGSDSLLFDPDANGFSPYFIAQATDGTWAAKRPDFTSTPLPGDGSIDVANAEGASLVRVVRPDAAADDAFYADSRACMDLALKGLNLRRVVGPDSVRVTSLGAAQSDVPYTDTHGRKWQERVWPVPFLDVYLVGLLLPTPDGYAAIMQYAPSSRLHAAKNQVHLLAGQFGTSLQGSLAQWQAYLRRRALLPDVFAGTKLDPSPDWSLQTRRFATAVPAAVMPLDARSPLTMTMGFVQEGPRLLWDVEEVWWNRDLHMDSAVGVWRRQHPPDSARLDLRNAYENMRGRRSPYDGHLMRDTAETFSVQKILDVPGKTPGMVSAELLYGVTVRVAGHPSLQEAQRMLDGAASAVHVFEHGPGADVAAAPARDSALDEEFAQSMAQAIAEAQKKNYLFGRDIRGRLLSEDTRQYLEGIRAQVLATPLGGAAADELEARQREQGRAFEAYWRHYPALTHNRDLWPEFLQRNGLPADTPHASDVVSAEKALRAALDRGTPEGDWAERAQDLLQAYILERSRSHVTRALTAADYRPRSSPCPAPADRTSGRTTPWIARQNRSAEDFWPTESKRLDEEGTVRVSLRISATGCAVAAAIATSSGSAMLDDAVMSYYETIDFLPADADGKPVEATVTLPIVFKLRN